MTRTPDLLIRSQTIELRREPLIVTIAVVYPEVLDDRSGGGVDFLSWWAALREGKNKTNQVEGPSRIFRLWLDRFIGGLIRVC